ncbi:MAG: porin [Acidiphilium sp.]|nr:porin [Acidiphilium sp.]MDD4934518.1 porin [Acidiphilium sp.]
MRKFLLASAATLGMVAGATSAAHAQAAKPPAPGTLVVHLNGLLTYQLDDVGSSVSTYGGSKLNPITNTGFLRLYPGFDAMTTGGFEYGVAAEIRDAYTNAGQGMQQNSTAQSGNGAESLDIRRAYAYFGTKEAGIMRVGQGDTAFSLMQDGVFENFGDGQQWNSDGGIGTIVPSATIPTWLWADQRLMYASMKIVYLSPDVAGFNFGVGFEPNSNGFMEGLANCATATTTCAALASTPGGAGDARRKNTIDGMLQYTGEFSGVGVKVSGGYLFGSPVGNSGPGVITGTKIFGNYKSLAVAQLGGQVSYAGFMLGANVKEGQVNNNYTFLLPGQRKALDWLISAEYNAGPVTVGGYYFSNQSAGNPLAARGVARTEQDNGVAVGANYAITPNIGLFVTYVYGQRKQYGFDFANNSTVGAATYNAAYDRTHTQAIGAGAALKW